MKAILEFNLPEEQEEHQIALDGISYRCALSELSNYLRSKIKYEEHTEEQYAVYEEIRSELYKILENDGLEI